MDTRVVIVALGFSLLLTVPTAAMAVGESDTTEAVELTPKSEYASIEKGELALDFDRLNKDATTSVDAVFEVTVQAENAERLWIEHDLDGVTFYADGNPNAEIRPGRPLSIEPGESTTVGVSIDTRDAPTGTQTFSIVVASEDDDDDDSVSIDLGGLAVTNASVEPTEVETGESVEVTATVTNPSNGTASGTVDLAVGPTVVDDRHLELGPDENRTISFTWTAREPGAYDLSVGGEPAGTVVVSDPVESRLGSYDLSSPLTAAVAPPATLGLLFLGSVARGRRR